MNNITKGNILEIAILAGIIAVVFIPSQSHAYDGAYPDKCEPLLTKAQSEKETNAKQSEKDFEAFKKCVSDTEDAEDILLLETQPQCYNLVGIFKGGKGCTVPNHIKNKK